LSARRLKEINCHSPTEKRAGAELTATGRPMLSVVVCAHNEAEYIGRCLRALGGALRESNSYELIVVADRCTDNTVEVARQFSPRIVEKTWKRWQNSYSESLQAGYEAAKGTSYFAIVDADVIVSPDFFAVLEPMLTDHIGSVSSDLLVYPSRSVWNRIIYYWQRTYAIAPLGAKPWGACRILTREALDQVKGFHDSPVPDSDLDLRLASKGYRSILVRKVTAYHIREINSRKIIAGQIASGRGRYRLGESLRHTLAHAALRARPFVVAGWLMEYSEDKERH
jgi:glycosyltransferase involved in cell wall biosynthesis